MDDTRSPGVFVLGMHRSGTSVVAGLLDHLGLSGGPRETMFSPDEFNSDGYWEQRPIVELHDSLLGHLNGFASAPPAEDAALTPELASDATASIREILATFSEPWFVKDPRQCLLLEPWDDALDARGLVVVASRRPEEVIRSLKHRNGYSRHVAAGLWERYTRAVLRSVADRPCFFVQYDELLTSADEIVPQLAAAVDEFVVGGCATTGDRLSGAIGLVRPSGRASSSRSTFRPVGVEVEVEQQHLFDVVAGLSGLHRSFELPTLPECSRAGERAIAWRRRRLLAASLVIRGGSQTRAIFDRRVSFPLRARR